MPRLTKVWPRMKPHPRGQRYSHSTSRFNAVFAGRRSGKTLRGKVKVILAAIAGTEFDDPRFFLAAPTRDQAKTIFWKDIKAMIPRALQRDISESELVLTLGNGSSIHIVGLDKPQRIEGSPWDGGIITEFANVKPDAWPENIRPALSDRRGWCDLEGVPEGRNHAYTIAQKAQAEEERYKGLAEWGYHHWISAEVLPEAEIESARRNLDPLTYQQEYEASFVSFQGSAYYTWETEVHGKHRLRYNDRRPLILALDFNVAPGVAAVAQEQTLPNGEVGTGWIDEVWIERDSNTRKVMDRFLARYSSHRGLVLLHGDASGGAKGSAKVEGSDWELALQKLRPAFGSRLKAEYPKANPSERSRLNAVNSRLRSALGTVRMMVDPATCPHLVLDFEGVDLDDDGSIDKGKNHELSHMCFRGDTQVRTPGGPRRMDALPSYGLVQGWDGRWTAYEDARRTIEGAPIVEVTISGAAPVYCTPWHQFLTATGEWVCARDLRGRKLRHWQSLSSPPPPRHSGGSGTTSRGDTMPMARSGYTGRCGPTTTAPSLPDATFTTGTGIGPTTNSRTSILSQPRLTILPTHPTRRDGPDSSGDWRLGGLPRRSGTEAPKDGAGTANTTSRPATGCTRSSPTPADTAVRATRARAERTASARGDARPHGATTMAQTILSEVVRSAAAPSRSTAMPGPRPAAGSAVASSALGTVLSVRPAGRADVYCLRVPSDGCFALADGWIVSNSDAAGYYVRQRFPVSGEGAGAKSEPLNL